MITIQKIDKTEVSPSGNTILAEFRGLSTDTKPTTTGGKDIENGSMFIEIDTGKIYLFDKSGSQWVEMIGGGSEPNLQDKTVTITENTTTTITADSGYDALGSVAVTTNVGYNLDWTAIGYTGEPTGVDDIVPNGYNVAKDIYDNWDDTIDSCSNMYANNAKIIWFPVVDTSNVTTTTNMFNNCKTLQKFPELDFSKLKTLTSMFNGCANLTEVGDIVTTQPSQTFNMGNMFLDCVSLETAPMIKNVEGYVDMGTAFKNCSKLKNVPLFDIGTVRGFSYMTNAFQNCPLLTNESLNNILGIIKNAYSVASTKTLANIGLSEAQATTCTTLSNWSAVQAKGWTTGY